MRDAICRSKRLAAVPAAFVTSPTFKRSPTGWLANSNFKSPALLPTRLSEAAKVEMMHVALDVAELGSGSGACELSPSTGHLTSQRSDGLESLLVVLDPVGGDHGLAVVVQVPDGIEVLPVGVVNTKLVGKDTSGCGADKAAA